MDSPEPGLIKWSPNAAHDSFLYINLQHRVVQVYEPSGRAQRGRFDYRKTSQHDDFPPLRSCDWSPSTPGILAVGTSTGVVNLLRIDDGSNAYLELGLKMSRTCQAVAFSTAGRLAVGLDRVRSDNCLYIWDVNRLSSMDGRVAGFPAGVEPFTEPTDRLEPSVSVSSVKFFEDNPSILVAGVKGQGLRIHDLRGMWLGWLDHGHGPVMQFPTKCCNNLAIDYADPNYFASSALDQPGVMVWDRRASQRQHASPAYLEAIDQDELPWGGALRLDRIMQTDARPALADNLQSFVRSLRFCRDRPGLLAVLSRTGQLKVLSTKQEQMEPELYVRGSPELLEVRRSHELDPLHAEPGRRNERIVSFDWVTMNSPVQQPRLLVLRANSAFEILEKPSFTAEYAFKLIPWQPPHRGLQECGKYHAPMEFDSSQCPNMLGPLATEILMDDIPLFGKEKPDLESLIRRPLNLESPQELAPDEGANRDQTPARSRPLLSIAERLTTIRMRWKEQLGEEDGTLPSALSCLAEPRSQLENHHSHLDDTRRMAGFSAEAREAVHHMMLLRAKEKYLFDFQTNQQVVADDPWLQDVWAWVAGAEEAAADGKTTSNGIDMGYTGVYPTWMDFGSQPDAKPPRTTNEPADGEWTPCLNNIIKQLGIPDFDGVETKRPQHRALCVAICQWGLPDHADEFEARSTSMSPLNPSATMHTRLAALALFRGDAREAVRVLKKASTQHPELLFVSLALQLTGQGQSVQDEVLDFDERMASKTDPYLRAMSSIIATGDWTTVANQQSLPLRDRVLVAVRHFPDEELTAWLGQELARVTAGGNLAGVVLTGLGHFFVDVTARFVQRFGDYQTAALLLGAGAPRLVDDVRAFAFRERYRAYLQRHRAFFLRAKFDIDSTKRSKQHGRPALRPPARQIALRCVYCDAETSLNQESGNHGRINVVSSGPGGGGRAGGVSCPNCMRHLPRCSICLEVVGMLPSGHDSGGPNTSALRFPTFCLGCEHVLHLEHARQWFARHQECPVPECRCRCNFRANPELNYQ